MFDHNPGLMLTKTWNLNVYISINLLRAYLTIAEDRPTLIFKYFGLYKKTYNSLKINRGLCIWKT